MPRVELRNYRKARTPFGSLMRLFRYFKHCKPILICAVASILVYVGATIAAAYCMKPLTNLLEVSGIAPSEAYAKYISLLIGLAALYLLSAVTNYLLNRLMLECSAVIMQKLRTELFGKMQQLPIRYFDENTNGSLMSYFTNDIEATNELLQHAITQMLISVTSLLGTIGMMLALSLRLFSLMVALAAIVIVLVLTLTSRSYAEVPVLIMTFGAAALLNMGTNFLCGTISFISNSVTVILQLALAIDYAIILCHRFSDEHETKDTREACIAALSKGIPEISSSSLTTISGLGALAFMHFGIGRDMATVLIKAILFSLLSVFTLMPGLLMVFSKKIDATRHKNLIPKITFLGKFDVATRFIVPPIFAVVVVVTAVLANKCPYCYSYTDLVTAKQSESQIAHQKIKNTFGVNNMVAVIVPTGDYDSERQLLKDLDSCAEVKSTQGLTNIDAMDGYKLADALTPRQMSELAGLDYEVAEALYAAYAVDQNEYGKLISGLGDYKVPLFDMFMFLQREMKDGNITLDGDIQETLDDLFEQLNKAQLQLQSDKYSRLVVYLNLPEESDETMDFLDTMHALIAKYYSSDTYIVGNSTNVKDLSSSFGEDNMLISVLSALFVVIILLFTFKSAGLPVLLIVVIQGSIWINFSVPTIQHESLYFLGYLIVNSIQMGANIDYAIVISSHYTDLKKEMRPKEAIIAALNEAFPTIFTSGTILAVAGALIGVMTTNPVIAAIGTCLGRGTVISIVLVMAVLPQILLIGDTIVERTSFDVKVPVDLSRVNRTASGNMRVSGRVRGYVNGVIDAEIKGTLNGTLKASVTSGTTIEPTKPDFYLPESKEQAAAEWAENYTEGEEV